MFLLSGRALVERKQIDSSAPPLLLERISGNNVLSLVIDFTTKKMGSLYRAG